MRLFTLFVIIVNIFITKNRVYSTIDINLSELQYLSMHLDNYECRKLVAALHYTTHDLPKDISAAIRNVRKDIPCLNHLVHWNNSPSEGRGKTHTELQLRLRQINRNDLAKWLGITVFKKLGDDVLKSIDKPFRNLGANEDETQFPSSTDKLEVESEEEEGDDVWQSIDRFFMTLLVILIICLLLLVISLIISYLKWYIHKKIKITKRSNKYKKMSKACEESSCVNRKNAEEQDTKLTKVKEKKDNEEIDKEKNLRDTEREVHNEVRSSSVYIGDDTDDLDFDTEMYDEETQLLYNNNDDDCIRTSSITPESDDT